MKKSIFPLIFFSLLFFGACESEEQRQKRRAIIQQAYEERIAQYQADHTKKCRQEVMELAKFIADSTMLSRARNIKVVDSLGRPPKPNKPLPPPTKILEDTLEVAPLLPLDTLNFSIEN